MSCRLFLRGFCIGLLLGGLLLGCHKPIVQQKVPPDPLLISKKPVEGRTDLDPASRFNPQPLIPGY